MKILLVSDEESPYLWDYYQPGRLAGIDLILSCGDLAPEYLSFLVTMCNAPVLYVHGNHDGRYRRRPPEGCECIEDRVVNVAGLRIAGLGGCQRYSAGEHQYTEKQMQWRVRKLHRRIKKQGGVDIIISHAPVSGLGDQPNTLTHRGFEAFHQLLSDWKPRYWAYGHVHMRYGQQPRIIQHGDTVLINACERYTIEMEPS